MERKSDDFTKAHLVMRYVCKLEKLCGVHIYWMMMISGMRWMECQIIGGSSRHIGSTVITK